MSGKKKRKFGGIIAFFIIFSFVFQFYYIYLINNSIYLIETEKQVNIFPSAEDPNSKQWLENNGFDSKDEWYSKIEGDSSDVDADISDDHANFKVLGVSNYSYILGTPQATDWTNVSNPAFPILPDTYIINEQGFRVEHTWNEGLDQTRNTPSGRLNRTITMPVDMSDYIITSASITAEFNASVVSSPTSNGIDTPNDGIGQFSTGDYARFYVLISDALGNQFYEVASNQTKYLGQDPVPGPEIDHYPDTLMNTVPEDVLIAFLTSVLKVDDYNFTITLGIDLYCEDNIAGSDVDIWNYLIIRSLNLTFTYEKKIDQSTFVSWNQDGKKISGRNLQITNAILNFKYKTDKDWDNYASSPNSEIRILINDNLHSETIKLSSAKTSFRDGKEDGFDVTSLIPKDKDISLSLQVFLADEFNLDDIITISIDDVYLYITIIEVLDWGPIVIGLGIGMIALVTIFTLYETHYKYPPMVRKVRKLRKKIKKGKKTKKPIKIKNRGDALKDSFYNQIKILELETIQPEIVDKVEKITINEKIKELEEEVR